MKRDMMRKCVAGEGFECVGWGGMKGRLLGLKIKAEKLFGVIGKGYNNEKTA
jgi:hypothetical protein